MNGHNQMNSGSSLLIQSPRTHRFWWTMIPVLPTSRNEPAYRMLRRQWADHTMNTVKQMNGESRPGPRGCYTENREDHITMALFQIWAAFPGTEWARHLLALWNIPHEQISDIRWSYSWEQKRSRGSRPEITGVVVCWRDERGDAVLVIEAKRPGGNFKDRDLDGAQSYLTLPSLRQFARRYVGFLLDEHDVSRARILLPKDTPIATWQEMGTAQAAPASILPIEESDLGRMQALIARHYCDLGVPFDRNLANSLGSEFFEGSDKRYAAVRARNFPPSVEAFFLGSEVSICARGGRMPTAPHQWLLEEPSLLELASAPQPTSEREFPFWRIPSMTLPAQA